MAASIAEIEIEGGIVALKCPITGIEVITPEEGFNPEAEHSPHLRFFVDWIGGVWVANPDDLPDEQAQYQEKIISIFANQSEADNQNALIAKCVEVLPNSAFVLEILDPPVGSFDGEICYACFDLGAAASKPHIRMQEAG
jgi:hypothetical protein